MAARIAAADSYLAKRPGVVGFVLRDRTTGAAYRNTHAADPVWTASTIKLAMVVDLLTRQRAGSIPLTDADNRLITAMLNSSADDAADREHRQPTPARRPQPAVGRLGRGPGDGTGQ
jgi:beta-lactamase class A